jgi:hypothetical protein
LHTMRRSPSHALSPPTLVRKQKGSASLPCRLRPLDIPPKRIEEPLRQSITVLLISVGFDGPCQRRHSESACPAIHLREAFARGQPWPVIHSSKWYLDLTGEARVIGWDFTEYGNLGRTPERLRCDAVLADHSRANGNQSGYETHGVALV